MKFNMTNDKERAAWIFEGSISYNEMASLRLDSSDIALLDKYPENAADYLLVLELLFRRYDEQTNAKQKS